MNPADLVGPRQIALRHGWNATALQTTEEGFSYFSLGDDAYVAYVDTGRAWVVAGAPVAGRHRLQEVAAAFLDAAWGAGKRVCFFGVEEKFLEEAKGRLDAFPIGEQPVWDPRSWGSLLSGHPSLREQLRRARAKGVMVRQVHPSELFPGSFRIGMESVAARWLATRRMAPMEFLVRLGPFSPSEHRRYFVAEQEGRIVAFAGAIPVPGRNGWFLEDLVRDPSAPNGTGELLVDGAMGWAAGEGSTWFTLGLAPLAGDVSAVLRLARRHGAALYDFEGLRRYKAKFQPSAWLPIHLAHPPCQGEAISLLDALHAFAPGGLLRFGLRSLTHRFRTSASVAPPCRMSGETVS